MHYHRHQLTLYRELMFACLTGYLKISFPIQSDFPVVFRKSFRIFKHTPFIQPDFCSIRQFNLSYLTVRVNFYHVLACQPFKGQPPYKHQHKHGRCISSPQKEVLHLFFLLLFRNHRHLNRLYNRFQSLHGCVYFFFFAVFPLSQMIQLLYGKQILFVFRRSTDILIQCLHVFSSRSSLKIPPYNIITNFIHTHLKKQINNKSK